MNKVTEAQHRIEDLYYKTNGNCYLSFSGGKDSTVVLSILKSCVELGTIPPIKAVYVDTGIEMGVTKDFVKWCKGNYYPEIEVIRPQKSFDWVLKNYGKPLRSKLKSEFIGRWNRGLHSESTKRNLIDGKSKSGGNATRTKLADKDMHMIHPDFNIPVSSMCCNILKKKPLREYEKQHGITGFYTGMRMAEGGARVLSMMSKSTKPCELESHGVIQKMPIVDWNEEDIETYIKENHVPLSRAYTEYGFTRTGCMACPFAMDIENNLKYLYEHEPNRYKAAMHWLKDVYIAQNVLLPFDKSYEIDRERMWLESYDDMRNEMLKQYRPDSKMIYEVKQQKLF